MQCGLLYLSVHTHGFAVPLMLDTGTMQSFVSCKLLAKLPATVKTMTPLTIILPTRKTLVATLAIQLNMLIDDPIYLSYCYILPLVNPLILGNDFYMCYGITLDLA